MLAEDAVLLLSATSGSNSNVGLTVESSTGQEAELEPVVVRPWQTMTLRVADVLPAGLKDAIIGLKLNVRGALVASVAYVSDKGAIIAVKALTPTAAGAIIEEQKAPEREVTSETAPGRQEAASAFSLALPWASGQYWVPQTYDNHVNRSGLTPNWVNTARYRVDFYWASPQAAQVRSVDENAGRDKFVYATHPGLAGVYRYRFSAGACGDVSEDWEVFVRSDNEQYSTWYVHMVPAQSIRVGDSV